MNFNKNLNEVVGNLFREHREKKDMRTEEVAEHLDISRTTLYNMESGLVSPKLDLIFSYAKLLGPETQRALWRALWATPFRTAK